jgi:hypothetical protein
MKNVFAPFAVLAFCVIAIISLNAADYPSALQGSTSGYQAIIGTGNQTNVYSLPVDNYKYHTLAMVNALCFYTNASTNPALTGESNTTTASWTLDGTNYVPALTNTFTTNIGIGGNTVVFTGHVLGWRAITVLAGGATNCNVATQIDEGN